MALHKLTDDINMMSESIRCQCNEFKATPLPKPIFITESSVSCKSELSQDIRPKQGAAFWQHFADVTKSLGDDEEITRHTTTFDHQDKKYKSLKSHIASLRKQVHARSSDSYLDSRVHEQQERNEKEWENQMESGQQTLDAREAQLNHVQKEIEDLDKQLQEDQNRAYSCSEEVLRDIEALKEILLLRAEEKKDMLAALDALKRKTEEVDYGKKTTVFNSPELEELERKRDALKESILECEALTSQDVQLDRSKLDDDTNMLTAKLRESQAELEVEEQLVADLKEKMRKIVKIYAQAPGTSLNKIIALVLDVLYGHNGEITKSELQAEVASRVEDDTQVIRAIYALVGKGLVHIDRSHAEGIVTSLLI